MSSYTSSARRNESIIDWSASGMQQKRWYICHNYVKRWSTMTLFRNRMFLEGLAVEGICGILIVSVIAFPLRQRRIEPPPSATNKLFPGPTPLPFHYTLHLCNHLS